MAASVSRPAGQLSRFGRLWWLPAGGHGSGLNDQAWAPALQISELMVPRLRHAAVPAYTARVRPVPRRRRGRGQQPGSCQLYAGTCACGRAVMPWPGQEAARRGDRARR